MNSHNIFSDWLYRRKISQAVIDDFEISYSTHSLLGECIVIPVKNESGVWSFNKYRRSPLKEDGPKYVYDKGGHVTLFGAWRLADNNKSKGLVLWVEGELDALVAWSHNVPAVSSTGGALSMKREWAELLKGHDIILCFDNDEAGGLGMVKALEIVPTARVVFIPDRAGVKDLSDYVVNGGDIHSLLAGARSFDSVEQVVEERAKRVASWQSVHFHDEYLKYHAEKKRAVVGDRVPNKRSVGGLDRAKQYPIDELIEINREGKSKCLWHNEVHGSMHYYKDTNRVYCFGQCGKMYDAIDVYRKLHNCSFTEAIKSLQ